MNNRGVAQMGQQFTEKAADSFAEAFKKDPKMAQAAINEGIALMTLQKLDEAKKALQAALALDPNSAQAWYNLGLAQHAGNELDAALDSFQHAVKLDPRDVDSWYFVGVCYGEMKQFDKAIETFNKTLEVNPIHASAEFQLARALQRSGNTPEAKEHFKIFQHLTSTKISAAIGLAYGEQGHYSTVSPIEEPESRAQADDRDEAGGATDDADSQVSKPRPGAPSRLQTGGACMMDVTGSGQMDLVLMQSGEQAIRVLHRSGTAVHSNRSMRLPPASRLPATPSPAPWATTTATASTTWPSPSTTRLLLFRNLGKGKFQDATAEAGLAPRNRPTGITFIDYDHDGDLDLLITGLTAQAWRRLQRPLAQQRQQDLHRVDRAHRPGRQRHNFSGHPHRLQ